MNVVRGHRRSLKNNLTDLAMSNHEELYKLEQELKTLEQQTRLEHDARFWALHSMLRELLQHAGVSEDDFQRHFLLRKNHYHDKFLRGLEDTHPKSAARLDARSLSDIPESSDFPPLPL